MQRVGKRLSARRASQGMAFALAKRRNTAGDRFPARSRALAVKGNRPLLGLRASTGCSVPTRPKGASQRIQCSVAVLEKGDGHSLRTASCLVSSGMLCVRNYYLDRVLVFRGITPWRRLITECEATCPKLPTRARDPVLHAVERNRARRTAYLRKQG